MNVTRRSRRKSGLSFQPKLKQSLGFAPAPLGQSYPQHSPQHCPSPEPMGVPLSIREAARLIGCSTWSIRQTLLPRGLPYFRIGGGKLIFYTNQIIRWIETQQKGAM
jgi:hypothetical protein